MMHIINIKNERTIYILVNMFITVSFFQKLPVIFENYYKIFTVLLFILLIGILGGLLSNIVMSKNTEEIILIFIFLSIYSLCMEILSKVAGYGQINSKEFFLPLLFIVIGKYSPLSKDYFIVYIWQSVILGLSIVYYYVGTFEILTNYAYSSKNQMGPMIAFGAVIALLYSFHTLNKFQKKIYRLIFVVILVLLMLLRARATLLSLLFTSVIIIISKLYSKRKRRLNYRFLLIILMSMLFLFLIFTLDIFNDFRESIFNFVIQSFTKNYNIYDLNSLSAGRTSVYKEVLHSIFWEAPFGLINKKIFIAGIPHNYVLNKILNVGYIGALPYIFMYLYLFKLSLCQSKKNKLNQISTMLLLTGLIIGIFEYTIPFGPFSSTYIIWFSLGQAIQERKEANICEKSEVML